MTQYTPPPAGGGGIPGGDDIKNKKLVAGILAILLGWLGVHKFYLGMNTPGIIMLVLGIFSCGAISSIIGIIEGIIYLTKSEQDFYQQYIVEKKQWF